MTIVIRVGVEWVGDFPPSGQPCHQESLSHAVEHANGFLEAMKSQGHQGIFEWGDDNAWETDFRSPDFGGDSLHWSDNVHFCYFADHGLNENNTFFIGFSFQHEFCVGTSAEWRLGAGELKWLVLDTCDAVLNTDPSHIAATWGGPMQGCHMVFGFIGENTDEWFTRDRGKDFGNEVGAGTVLAESWLNHAYSWWLGDNPIAIAAGENEADAVNRRETESIGGRDFPVLTTAFLAWKWRS